MERILVAEDQSVIAWDLERLVTDCGLAVLGPVKDFGSAMQRASQPEIAGAILETRLGEEHVWALADLLRSRNVPFVFVTAWPTWDLPDRFRDVPCLQKPYDEESLRRVIAAMRRPGGGMPRGDRARVRRDGR